MCDIIENAILHPLLYPAANSGPSCSITGPKRQARQLAPKATGEASPLSKLDPWNPLDLVNQRVFCGHTSCRPPRLRSKFDAASASRPSRPELQGSDSSLASSMSPSRKPSPWKVQTQDKLKQGRKEGCTHCHRHQVNRLFTLVFTSPEKRETASM